MPLCEPWVDADDVECAGVDDPAITERAVTQASNVLWALSGRQFSGACTDVVRPCRWGDGCWAYGPWDAWGRAYTTLRDGTPPVGCFCAGPVSCSRSHDALELPHTPVIDVVEVLVDGAVLVEDWVIVDDRWLVRRSPERWPTTQLLDRLETEAGTWQVTYRYGTNVPADAVEAARALACELAKAEAGGDCALDPRTTSVIAENVSYDLAAPFDATALAGGLSVLPAVDLFLRARNPNRLGRRGRLLNPHNHRPRRHRRIRAASTAATPSAAVYSGGDASGTGVDVYSGGDAFGTGSDTYSGGSA